jgi:hypothetical protein
MFRCRLRADLGDGADVPQAVVRDEHSSWRAHLRWPRIWKGGFDGRIPTEVIDLELTAVYARQLMMAAWGPGADPPPEFRCKLPPSIHRGLVE